jgi:hypothetical protein
MNHVHGVYPRDITSVVPPVPQTMTESEWLDCDDPDILLAVVAQHVSPDALRLVACACCRRIFETYRSMFYAAIDSGQSVAPDSWQARPLLAAVEAAQAASDLGSAIEPVHAERASAAARWAHEQWQWANYRLGDTASGGDYEDAYLRWKSADAIAACCAEDVRETIAACLRSAAEAIGFRWTEADRTAAFAAERRAQADLMRRLLRASERT